MLHVLPVYYILPESQVKVLIDLMAVGDVIALKELRLH